MVDTINLFRIDFGPGMGCVEDAHDKQEIGILEPGQIVGNGGFRGFVSQSLVSNLG
jgi:hypothetical protein